MAMRFQATTILVLLCGFLFYPETAEARVFFFQFGDVVNEVGDLPEGALKKLPSDLRDGDGPNQPVAAYKCTEVSILWTLMYREDCVPVVVRNGTVLKSQDVAVTKAMNAAVGEAYPDGVPLAEGWESYGKWVVGPGLILAFLLPFFRRSAF